MGEYKGRPIHRALIILLAVAAFTLSGPLVQQARADGCYIPEKAYQKLPEIPTQRAIVRYKDGVEKLTIESSLNAEGQSFGWILPIPAKPTLIEETTPGLMDSFSNVMQPEIKHNASSYSEYSFAALWVLVWAVLVLAVRFRSRCSLVRLLMLMLVPWLISLIIFGGKGIPVGGSSMPDQAELRISVLGKDMIGSYEVATLKADAAGDLNQWLESNGFAAVPAEGFQILSDYIDEDWYFVVSRLRREGKGLCTPHPLSVTFAADTPVYPMRLTALSGTELSLDLFVIGDGNAGNERTSTVYTGCCHKRLEKLRSPWNEHFYEELKGRKTTVMGSVGHPGAEREMWNGCWVTRLQGRFKPGGDWNDLTLSLSPGRTFRAVYYSSQWAAQKAGILFSKILLLTLPLILFAYWDEIRGDERGRWIGLRICAMVVAVSAVCGLVQYSIIPKVEVTTGSGSTTPDSTGYGILRQGEDWIEDKVKDGTLKEMTKEEIHGRLEAVLQSGHWVDNYETKEVKNGDSPGNWQLYEDARGLFLRVYGKAGMPKDLPIKVFDADE